MAKQQTEDELNLRRKARRRLIGAVALTLAVVVILPMVLDNEPKPGGKDIDLSIPAPDTAGEFVTHVPISEVPVTLPSAGSAVAAGSAPVAVPARAIATPVPTPDAEKPVGVETYVAQVGAYSNQGTAKQELKKLKKWGFKAYTEKAGDKTRVRVGPYPDKDKAERAVHLLEKHGLHPVIISVK